MPQHIHRERRKKDFENCGLVCSTWFKVTSLNKNSPACSRALRDVSTYAEECGTTPYDLFRALSPHEISAYTASHTGKQTGDSSPVPCFWHSRRVAQTRVHWRRTEFATPSNAHTAKDRPNPPGGSSTAPCGVQLQARGREVRPNPQSHEHRCPQR